MGLFNRKTAVAPDAAAATTTTGRTHMGKREKHSHNAGGYSNRPTVGEWFKTVWVDLLTMVALGAVGLGVYEADPAPTRNFPVYFRDQEIVYPQFAYPLRKNIIPIWAAALIATLVPIAVFLIMQIRIRSFWNLNAAILGLLYGVINAAVFQVFIKWLIGGLRPHFLAVCKPNIQPGTVPHGSGLDYIMYNRTICTGKKSDIDDSLESMPSGHSTAAFAGFVFLFFYLNAHLKVWSNYHSAMWKQTATYAPLLGATLIAGSLTIDEFHNWYDCLAGAIIGTICAFGSYRMVFASIWDWRTNHIPLPRGTDGSHFDPSQGLSGFENNVWTRKSIWGNHVGGGVGGVGNEFDNRRGTETTLPTHNVNNTVPVGGGGGGMLHHGQHQQQQVYNV